MTVATVPAHDCEGANIAHLPAGQAIGYATGSDGVPWTAAEIAAHPGVVLLDQTPAGSVWDATADGDDYENGAVQLGELAGRARARMAAWSAGLRPGQRHPIVYCARSNVTAVVNALIAGGVTSGVGLIIADWDNNAITAAAEVAGGSGPFPIVGRQYASGATYDDDVLSVPWLEARSSAPPVRPPMPPGQWDDPRAWTWADVITAGVGLDHRLHIFHLEGHGWIKVQ